MAIYEMRVYTLKVGKIDAYLQLYHDEAMAIHVGHLGPPVGWWKTEVGALGQIVILWRYDSHADREARRARLQVDPAWRAFLPRTGEYIETMENRILTPTFFSPMQ